jgi:DNA-binding NarL/FixJ family response regulator
MNIDREDRHLLRLVTQAYSRQEIARNMRLGEADVDRRLRRVLRNLRLRAGDVPVRSGVASSSKWANGDRHD